MPYISTERVKEVRKQLKSTFPNVKFSVRRHHHSSVEIAIMKSPFDWGDTRTVNPYYLEHQPHAEFVKQVYSIANKGNRTLFHDGDYGAVPAFYVNIEIGKWDRPHVTINA